MAGIAVIFDQLSGGSVTAFPDDCYQGVAGLADAVEDLWADLGRALGAV